MLTLYRKIPSPSTPTATSVRFRVFAPLRLTTLAASVRPPAWPSGGGTAEMENGGSIVLCNGILSGEQDGGRQNFVARQTTGSSWHSCSSRAQIASPTRPRSVARSESHRIPRSICSSTVVHPVHLTTSDAFFVMPEESSFVHPLFRPQSMSPAAQNRASLMTAASRDLFSGSGKPYSGTCLSKRGLQLSTGRAKRPRSKKSQKESGRCAVPERKPQLFAAWAWPGIPETIHRADGRRFGRAIS